MMKSSDLLLSVIVPVYNAEEYLRGCVDSLLSSVNDERIEVILVDDGSTDNSPEIIDGFSGEYSNIIAAHSDNRGPSAARNEGLSLSSGKYVFFCDADDTVDSKALCRIIELIADNDTDVVLWDGTLIDAVGNPIKRRDCNYFINNGISEEALTGKEYLSKRIKTYGDYATVVWLGVYRKAFLEQEQLIFEENILYEDELWVPQVLLKAQSVICVSGTVYNYRVHNGSRYISSVGKRIESIESIQFIYKYLFGYCEDNLMQDNFKKLIEANLTRKYLHRIFELDFCKYGYGGSVDLKMLWDKSGRIIDRFRVVILYIRRLLRV